MPGILYDVFRQGQLVLGGFLVSMIFYLAIVRMPYFLTNIKGRTCVSAVPGAYPSRLHSRGFVTEGSERRDAEPGTGGCASRDPDGKGEEPGAGYLRTFFLYSSMGMTLSAASS
jgi:hypothetical protein